MESRVAQIDRRLRREDLLALLLAHVAGDDAGVDVRAAQRVGQLLGDGLAPGTDDDLVALLGVAEGQLGHVPQFAVSGHVECSAHRLIVL